jgi:hypothetical protein
MRGIECQDINGKANYTVTPSKQLHQSKLRHDTRQQDNNTPKKVETNHATRLHKNQAHNQTSGIRQYV